jgi:hypothetical protein
MSQTCDLCFQPVFRKVWDIDPETKKMVGKGVDCGCRRKPKAPVGTANPFEITFDHVHDEFGNKLHVGNMRELSAAEKRLGFQSVVLNSDHQNFDDPPQQKPITVADVYKRKFGGPRR